MQVNFCYFWQKLTGDEHCNSQISNSYQPDMVLLHKVTLMSTVYMVLVINKKIWEKKMLS
jgi:hypothetical protein